MKWTSGELKFIASNKNYNEMNYVVEKLESLVEEAAKQGKYCLETELLVNLTPKDTLIKVLQSKGFVVVSCLDGNPWGDGEDFGHREYHKIWWD